MSYSALSPNPRSDLFEFNFPDTFLQAKDEKGNKPIDKYNEFLNAWPQVLPDFGEVINESIQGISLPVFGYSPISQDHLRNSYSTSEQFYKANTHAQNLVQDKTFTVSLRHNEAYLSYFLLLELYFLHFCDNDHINLGTWNVSTMTGDGVVVYNVKYKDVLFLGMAGLDLSYVDESSNFLSFDLAFGYSSFSTSFNLPEKTDKFKSQNA